MRPLTPSPTPATYMTSHAAVMLRVYCPTLNSTFHSSLRLTTSDTTVANAWNRIAGHSPHRYKMASTKAVEVTTPCGS